MNNKTQQVEFPNNAAQIETVLAWRCEKVVSRISKNCDLSLHEAAQVFSDVKLFLFLTRLENKPLTPTLKIDKAWHEFLVFTKEYREFCLEVLGAFIDHCPTDDDEIKSGNTAGLSLCASKYVNSLSSNWAVDVGSADCVSCWGQSDPDEKDECSSKVFLGPIGGFSERETSAVAS